jgi:hypothetical protein
MTTDTRLCEKCQQRQAAPGRSKCWGCSKKRAVATRQQGGQHAPGWDKVPYGVRLTLTEIASITGLQRESVAYITRPSAQGRRKLPPGFEVIRSEPRIIFVIRHRPRHRKGE